MASGNFLIGNDLTFEGFSQYVLPIFEERGYSVQNKLAISYTSHRKSILASVVGEGDLEKGINDILVESGKIIKGEAERIQQSGSDQNRIAWEHQVSGFSHREREEGKEDVCVHKGHYETIGTYQADDTASQLFPTIAQEYLLKNVKVEANKVVGQIKCLLGKRLSDL